MRITIVAGLFALVAAYLIGGRYVPVVNENGAGMGDRLTGRVYLGGTTNRAPPQ